MTLPLTWRSDEYGKPDHALYLGRFFIGHVFDASAHPQHKVKSWRAWLYTSEEGEGVGYYETPDLARAALIEAATTNATAAGEGES